MRTINKPLPGPCMAFSAYDVVIDRIAGRILQDLTNIVNVVEDLQTRPQGKPKPTDFAN